MMTDREMLLRLCEKLGLKKDEADAGGGDYPRHDSYSEGSGYILIGRGDGYSGFYARFDFDEDGNITGHGIWE